MLEDMDELAIGMYKILEPQAGAARHCRANASPVKELDLVMVPGVAFDRRGARMGHGKGYYDKLLEHARPDAPLVALAFECQLFPEIPTQAHDIFMDKIITEHDDLPRQGASTRRESPSRSRRHLRRSVSQHLCRGADHGPRSHVAGSCHRRRDRQRLEHDPVRLRSGAGSVRRAGRRHIALPRLTVVPARSCNFTCRGFAKIGAEALERSLLVRISQNVLTCPTTACFNLIDSRSLLQAGAEDRLLRRWLPISRRALRPAGVGHSDPGRRIRRSIARFGYRDGLMGGNLWFMGATLDAALAAAERGAQAVAATPGVIMPFPGGIAASGSKAGSRYSFSIASTYRRVLPHAARQARRAIARSRRRAIDHGDHHQRRICRPSPARRTPRSRLRSTRPDC